jgi:ferredoxin
MPYGVSGDGREKMRVRIKDDICQGHGMCLLACPEIFQLSDEDGHAYLLSEDVPPELEAKVDQAVRSCPEQAIETC